MDKKDLIRIGLIFLAGTVLLYLVNNYSNKQNVSQEGFYTGTEEEEEEEEAESFTSPEEEAESFTSPEEEESFTSNSTGVSPSDGFSDKFSSLGESQEKSPNQQPKDCFPKDQLTPGELLPGDANSKWAQVNPAGQGELGDQNFLQAGHHIGVNTVGQTLRNANMQIRSEPPNPQLKVSPWLQSTIEPDTNRKPMEIGGCE